VPSNQVVKEILSTGGAFKHIPIDRTGEGYLKPDEFHKALLERCVRPLERTASNGIRGSFALSSVRNLWELAFVSGMRARLLSTSAINGNAPLADLTAQSTPRPRHLLTFRSGFRNTESFWPIRRHASCQKGVFDRRFCIRACLVAPSCKDRTRGFAAQVLMYCTGGIRCELASAYIRDLGVAQDVKVREEITRNEV
jgi:hypothetical protein